MGAANGAMAGATIFSTLLDAEAGKTQAAYQEQQYKTNAQLAELQAADSIERGNKEAADLLKKTKSFIGSQKVALAAQGIQIDSDTAAELQEQTRQQALEDALTLKNNAYREAFGFKVQASNFGNQASMAGVAGRNQLTSTLLTGAVRAGDYGTRNYGSKK